eukprot:TRINITY_DN23118_c0_g1_i2.p3 TRINITY_DN23118_c0_g1~~TRINITY_DN23118_c0_g1_i2.p3  ORF type:complete len:122 (-),score=56.04 TRINITY_DN23118_c0_g1_i2:94-459(-)
MVLFFFFFSSRRRHTRCREVSWARRCVQETGTWEDKKMRFDPRDTPGVGHYSPPPEKRIGPAFTLGRASKNDDYWEKRMYARSPGPVYQYPCLLYTSDAADDTPCVDLGGRRIIKKKKGRR